MYDIRVDLFLYICFPTYCYDPAKFIILVDVCANLLLEKKFSFKKVYFSINNSQVRVRFGLGLNAYYIALFSCELLSFNNFNVKTARSVSTAHL